MLSTADHAAAGDDMRRRDALRRLCSQAAAVAGRAAEGRPPGAGRRRRPQGKGLGSTNSIVDSSEAHEQMQLAGVVLITGRASPTAPECWPSGRPL